MNVGILLGDLQLQRRLAGGVFGQRAEDIRAVQQRLTLRLGGENFARQSVRPANESSTPSSAAAGNADGFGQLNRASALWRSASCQASRVLSAARRAWVSSNAEIAPA